MTLLSLFWPKEMREAVKRLRVEGNLNEEAVKHYNSGLLINAALGCIVALLLTLEAPLWGGLIGASTLAATYCLSYQIHFKRMVRPYLLGERCEAIVYDIKSYAGRVGKKEIICKLAVTENFAKIGPIYEKVWTDFHTIKNGEKLVSLLLPTRHTCDA